MTKWRCNLEYEKTLVPMISGSVGGEGQLGLFELFQGMGGGNPGFADFVSFDFSGYTKPPDMFGGIT